MDNSIKLREVSNACKFLQRFMIFLKANPHSVPSPTHPSNMEVKSHLLGLKKALKYGL